MAIDFGFKIAGQEQFSIGTLLIAGGQSSYGSLTRLFVTGNHVKVNIKPFYLYYLIKYGV
jgi:hypothetical protein